MLFWTFVEKHWRYIRDNLQVAIHVQNKTLVENICLCTKRVNLCMFQGRQYALFVVSGYFRLYTCPLAASFLHKSIDYKKEYIYLGVEACKKNRLGGRTIILAATISHEEGTLLLHHAGAMVDKLKKHHKNSSWTIPPCPCTLLLFFSGRAGHLGSDLFPERPWRANHGDSSALGSWDLCHSVWFPKFFNNSQSWWGEAWILPSMRKALRKRAALTFWC